VDWGDDATNLDPSTMPWDTGNQSGSTSDDNYYQNHRGYDGTGTAECRSSGSDSADWAESPDACDSSYVTFVHDYVCTEGLLGNLPTCEITTDPNGLTRLVNSPCRGTGSIGDSNSCVYQPRVHVKDNWGWCTGYCDSSDDSSLPIWEGTEEKTAGMCYGNECESSHCPSEEKDSSCVDSQNYLSGSDVTNPWINFDGYVVVSPK
jgi:hypothetical protein